MFHRTTRSVDGVTIAYSVSGTADTALLFIHGGLADRSFWDGQHSPFSHNYKVIALDLAGHGESGRDRQKWGIAEFAHDVLAVLDAERAPRAILVGTVAIEAALLAGPRVVAVIGVDTLHDIGRRIDPSHATAQADAWRRDFDGSLDRMLAAIADFDAVVLPHTGHFPDAGAPRRVQSEPGRDACRDLSHLGSLPVFSALISAFSASLR